MTMETEKIPFEEQLKLYNRKKRNRFFVKCGFITFIYLLIIVYFISPFARVSNYTLKGNVNYDSDKILEIAHLSRQDSLYFIDEKNIKDLIDNHPLFPGNHTKVSINPLSLTIEVKELAPGAYYNNIVYFNDGEPHEELYDNELVKDFLIMNSSLPKLIYSPQDDDKKTVINLIEKSYLTRTTASYEKLKYLNIFKDSKNLFSFYFSLFGNQPLIKVTFDPYDATDDEISIYLAYDTIVTLFNNATSEAQATLKETIDDEEKDVYSFVCGTFSDSRRKCVEWKEEN